MSTCEIKVIKLQGKFIPDVKPETVINEVIATNKDPRYTVNARSTSPNIIKIVAKGPTARGTHNFLEKVTRLALKKQNEVNDRILALYSERLSGVKKDLKRLEMKHVAENADYFDAKCRLDQEAFSIKLDMNLIRMNYGKVISGPTLENVPTGPSPILKLIFALILGLFFGTFVIMGIDYLNKVLGKDIQQKL